MSTYNTGWLIDRLKFLLHAVDSAPDTDFDGPSGNTNKWYLDALSQAYEDEINDAVEEVGWRRFKRVHTFTWPASQLRLVLPAEIKDRAHLELRDITSSSEGDLLLIGDANYSGTVFFYDANTLEYPTAGPSAAMSLKMEYVASASELKKNTDEPDLIPKQFRRLLIWSAGIVARDILDEEAPSKWVQRRDEMRANFHSFLAKGSPLVNSPAVIINHEQD